MAMYIIWFKTPSSLVPCSRYFCLVVPAQSPGCSHNYGGQWWGSHQVWPYWRCSEEPTFGHFDPLREMQPVRHDTAWSTKRSLIISQCLLDWWLGVGAYIGTITSGEIMVVWRQKKNKYAIYSMHDSKQIWINHLIANIPLKSGKWAKELPRQITASNPSPGFWMSSCKVSQLASSITEHQRRRVKLPRSVLNIHNTIQSVKHKKIKSNIPHWSKAGSFLRSHLDLSAYLSILSLASTLIILNPSSTSIMESTLQSKKHLSKSQKQHNVEN